MASDKTLMAIKFLSAKGISRINNMTLGLM